MINTQRYKDSVKTTQAFIQQQYNLVYNVENGRDQDLSCANSVVNKSGGGTPRGQTDCVLMGRYLRVTDGATIRAYAIVGKEIDNDTSTNDAAAILARNPKRVSENVGLSNDTLSIPWQAVIVGNAPNEGPQNIVIAIIRSPLTGTVHTYSQKVANNVSMPLIDSALLLSSNEAADRVMCLDAGAPLTGGQLGVVIKKYASSQSFVQTVEDGTGTCG